MPPYKRCRWASSTKLCSKVCRFLWRGTILYYCCTCGVGDNDCLLDQSFFFCASTHPVLCHVANVASCSRVPLEKVCLLDCFTGFFCECLAFFPVRGEACCVTSGVVHVHSSSFDVFECDFCLS